MNYVTDNFPETKFSINHVCLCGDDDLTGSRCSAWTARMVAQVRLTKAIGNEGYTRTFLKGDLVGYKAFGVAAKVQDR